MLASQNKVTFITASLGVSMYNIPVLLGSGMALHWGISHVYNQIYNGYCRGR